MRAKTRTVSFVPKQPDELPVWNFDGSSTGEQNFYPLNRVTEFSLHGSISFLKAFFAKLTLDTKILSFRTSGGWKVRRLPPASSPVCGSLSKGQQQAGPVRDGDVSAGCQQHKHTEILCSGDEGRDGES